MNKIDIFKNKKVLITGHSGFKGSWLATWLNVLGAKVFGISLDVPTQPAHYDLLKDIFSESSFIDISDTKKICKLVKTIEPDYLFHLAAQPIVLTAYSDPISTFKSNTLGTANILESLRLLENHCVAVIITSDKSYDNREINRGYVEDDLLGGKDPYSGSKGAAELVIKSYTESFFKVNNRNIKLAVGRAGNVIGGGDWGSYRLIPDCVRSWSKDEQVKIRNPLSTRPWQHVLEPLSGYLTLAADLRKSEDLVGECFNFGPKEGEIYTVEEIVNEISKNWSGSSWQIEEIEDNKSYEANLLQLNCEKAYRELNWKSNLDFKQTSEWTAEWYHTYYKDSPTKAFEVTLKQINRYIEISEENSR